MRHPSPISSPEKNWLYFKSSFKFYKIDSEERDLVNIFASLSLKPSNLPARDAPWKGGFILDAATPGEFIGVQLCLSLTQGPRYTCLTKMWGCQEYINKNWACSIHHVYREFNLVADKLVELGSCLELGFSNFHDPPDSIRSFLSQDLLAVCYSRLAILFKYIQNQHEACTRRGRWLQLKFRFSINSSFDLFSSVSAASSFGFGTEKRPNPPRSPAQPPSARLAAEDGGCSRSFASLSTQASIWFLRFRLLCTPGSAPKKDPTRLGGPPSRLAPA
ncbi:unnamed protein product [Prunus armeniaca]